MIANITNLSVFVLVLRALVRKQKVLLMLALVAIAPCAQAAYSLVITNGYGDVYRMNLMRDRYNYQGYRGICSYRGFALSGCSTTGEVVMLRIKPTSVMPEHYSIVSTSMRWGRTKYFLNDVFRWLNNWTMYGYENWYPNNMSCSVAMYISSGGFSAKSFRPEPLTAINRADPFVADNGTGTNLIGALLPLTGVMAVAVGSGAVASSAAVFSALKVGTDRQQIPSIAIHRMVFMVTSRDNILKFVMEYLYHK